MRPWILAISLIIAAVSGTVVVTSDARAGWTFVDIIFGVAVAASLLCAVSMIARRAAVSLVRPLDTPDQLPVHTRRGPRTRHHG